MKSLPINLSLGLSLVLIAASQAQDRLDFARDIRPILSNNCFKCHGPDEKERKGGLRLDTEQGAFASRKGRTAFSHDGTGKSEVINRIGSDDPDEKMPPPDSGKRLTDAQVELIQRWVRQGAHWSTHWAFVPPKRPAVPTIGDKGWPRNDIDHFILSRLEREGLRPSSPAQKVRLLRRLSLDLIGLPPTPQEIEAFLADTRDQAYDNQVERLLASPHYGEKWARQWLDAARYADSDGYEKDKSRRVWFYRDWVINAFNRDLPYDRFIVDQIAGDLLPHATQDQIVATGFLRNSMINEEGGVDPEQFRMEAMFDRMDAIGKAILGLTIQCAQCHSHKYDPLTHEEYYRLFAFINSAHEANIAVYTPEEQHRIATIQQQTREIEEQLKTQTPDWAKRMAQWELASSGSPARWTTLEGQFEHNSTGGQKFLPQGDGSFLAQGYAPTKFRPMFTATPVHGPITGIRLELLTDPNLPLGGPGRSLWGTCALTEFEAEAAPADAAQNKIKIKFVRASSDVNPSESQLKAIFDDKSNKPRVTGPVEYAIDAKDETAWGIDIGPGRRNQPRNAVFVPDKPIVHEHGAILTIYPKQFHGGWNSDDNQSHNLGRFRFSVTSDADPKADPLPAAVRQILAIPSENRTPEQQANVFSYWRTTVPQWAQANARIEDLWKQHPEGSAQLVMVERQAPRETHILERGDFLKPGNGVQPGVPSFLHPLPPGHDADAPRLQFARWLASRESATTARVIVNRIWQSYFGTGLVETAEDFGSQGSPPSHPQLLDWLAVEFMDSGWSLKNLHRLIVNSATYRQDSKVAPELYARDPYNRLLARGPRFRVDAEQVRDIALAASGLLNPRVGGPSVFPPAPEFLFKPPASYGPKVWDEAMGQDRYRRALYTFRYRSVPYPALQAFDAPNGDFACVRRVRSNTPLQALTTLNEPLFMECARALAMNTLRDGGQTDAQRLRYLFTCCTAHSPSPGESAILLDLLGKQTARFAANDSHAWALAAQNPDQPPQLPQHASAAQLAAWTALARVVLNLDEAITKE